MINCDFALELQWICLYVRHILDIFISKFVVSYELHIFCIHDFDRHTNDRTVFCLQISFSDRLNLCVFGASSSIMCDDIAIPKGIPFLGSVGT